MNSTQPPTLRDALRSVRESLQFANDNPGGPISDTIWMMHGPETMFDFIDAALDAAADATDQGQAETVDREIGATAARPAPIGAVAPDAMAGSIIAHDFLEWNRSLDKPVVEISKELYVARKVLELAAAPAAPIAEVTEDPRITAIYKLRDIAERNMDAESASIISGAIGDLHAKSEPVDMGIPISLDPAKPTPGATMLDAIEREGVAMASIDTPEFWALLTERDEGAMDDEHATQMERAIIDHIEAYARGQQAVAVDGAPSTNSAAEVCEWTLTDDDNGIWESSCGEAWSFIDGGPVENGVRFCQGCGKATHIATMQQSTTDKEST